MKRIILKSVSSHFGFDDRLRRNYNGFMDQNQVIFLNGTSSSGKTTLARALQGCLEKPYLHISEDMFFAALPSREYTQAEYFQYGSRLYHGFTQCVRTLVECENRVIVDTVAWNPGSLAGFVNALWDLSVFAVGVHCPLALLEERERQRNDRSAGLARRQFELVHRDALYDLEIDTSQQEINACAVLVAAAIKNPPVPHAFALMKRPGTGPDTGRSALKGI
jgi:chloramphenicol 3-O phosphotransferase